MDILLLPTLLLAALGLLALTGWYMLQRTIRRRQAIRRSQEERVTLSIKVSRVNEQGPIATEQMFATLHGMLKSLTFSDRLEGDYQEHLSFEIVCHKQQIEFFANVPRFLREFVEGQIYAQYPDVEIREVKDYTLDVVLDTSVGTVASARELSNASTRTKLLTSGSASLPVPLDASAQAAGGVPVPGAGAQPPPPPQRIDGVLQAKVVAATEITLAKDTALPIKLAKDFGAIDPLSGITATLGKLDAPNEEVWLQILVRPVPDTWQEGGVALAEKMRSGKSTDRKAPIVVRILLSPFTALAALIRFLTPSSGDEAKAPSAAPKKELSEQEKRFVDGVIEKAGKLGYEVKIRSLFISGNAMPSLAARTRLQSVIGSFKQFNTTMLNGFAAKPLDGVSAIGAYRARSMSGKASILNIEELATVYHLPNVSVKTPNIVWVTSKKTEPPVNVPTLENTTPDELTLLGETNFRGLKKIFGIKTKDRMRHVYIIGKTGMGKSVLLENIAISDVRSGRGITVVDPHGDLADHVLEAIPAWRAKDVVLFDPADTAHPVALNLLENINPEYRPLIASGIVAIFYKLFANSWGPRLEHVLRNTLLALLETPGTTLLGVMRMLVDTDYRAKIVANVTDPVVRSFWVDEFANFKPQNLSEIVGPIQNKVGQFLSSHVIRNVVGQEKSTINIRQLMDEGKIFIVNLSKGKLGDDASALFGSMLITKIQLDAMSRANVPEAQRIDHHLIVDEFQNFATDAFAVILAEARKYHLSLTMANQYVAQMSDVIKGAVFGNVGSLVSFQVGYDDATYFSNQYAKTVTDIDVMSLDKYNIFVRLLIDNMPSAAFSASTLPPPSLDTDPALVEEIREYSRATYSHPRAEVEDAIRAWSEEGRASSAQDRGVHINAADLPLGMELAATVNNLDEKLGIFVTYFNLGGLCHVSEIPDKSIRATLQKGSPITVWLLGTKGDKLSVTLNPKKAEALRALNPQVVAPPAVAQLPEGTPAPAIATPDVAPAPPTAASPTPMATPPAVAPQPASQDLPIEKKPIGRGLPPAPKPAHVPDTSSTPAPAAPATSPASPPERPKGNILDLKGMMGD